MKRISGSMGFSAILVLIGMGSPADGQIPASITTPDRVESRIGRLEFKDGAPSVETAEKVRDTLDFTRALNVYNNSFRGASAYALGQGFQSIGAEENNTIVIFSELMDAKSLFLTANADTVTVRSRRSSTRAGGRARSSRFGSGDGRPEGIRHQGYGVVTQP
jgi:hypothetical protein